MAKKISFAVIGAGSRGFLFADILSRLPQGASIVAVAEPREEYRRAFAARYGVPAERVFADWRAFSAKPRMCDAVVIATPDREHVEPAVSCTMLGYHMLLEKPMAVTLEDCRRIVRAQREARTITSVCHSLRYNRCFARLKETIDSGRIGRVVTIDQLEQVAWWHHAHSFVRGNWAREDRSTFMLLAKSCHDIDYIAYLAGSDCLRASSFGALSFFRRENAPADSGDRCVACARERSCPYSAIRIYVDSSRDNWPASVVSIDHGREAHMEAIARGPYGRCVWKCDNDAVDHQIVGLQFAGSITATFTMTAFTQELGRKIRVHGTEGEIEFSEQEMRIRTFSDRGSERVSLEGEAGGHGGGDERVTERFLSAIRESNPRLVLTDVGESLRTHAIVFAAETSRREGRSVEMEDFWKRSPTPRDTG